MACLGIKSSAAAAEASCGLCGRGVAPLGGPELFLVENLAPVCRECGKKEAPHLEALLLLAQVAERVGRIKRYTLVPPLEALLKLAGAAEEYACRTSPVP